MVKRFFNFIILSVLLAGCAGYTNQIQLPQDVKTIYVPTVQNRLQIEHMAVFVPGMEVDMTNAIIDRFNFDGTLKVVRNREDADSTLQIVLTYFDQQGARFTNLESIEEYRLYITTEVDWIDNRSGDKLLVEKDFRGQTSYFRQLSKLDDRDSGSSREPLSEPLKLATDRAIVDYAHNVVDLITEAW